MLGKKLHFRIIKIFYVLWAGALVIASGGDSSNSLVQKRPLWEGIKRIQIQKTMKIGSDDLESNEMFGFISDFFISQSGLIYILDYKNGRACQYTREGKYVRTIGKGLGQGPGEFIKAMQICVDGAENVYIIDTSSMKTSIFDRWGTFIKAVNVEKMRSASGVLVDNQMKIIFAMSPLYISPKEERKGVFQVFSLPDWIHDRSFGIPINSKKNNVSIGGNSLTYDHHKDNLVVSYAWPYQIEIYDQERVLKYRFGRYCEYYHKQIIDGDITYSRGSSYKIAILGDGKIINLIRCVKDKTNKSHEIINYLDVFDEQGNYLLSVEGEAFGGKGRDIRGMRTDKDGNLYLIFEDPYPRIEKFNINFVDIKKTING